MEKQLIEILKPQMLQYLPNDWKKVQLVYAMEKWVGNYILKYLDNNENEESVCPSKYSLSQEETKALNEYIKNINSTKNCNKLIVNIRVEGEIKIESTFDNELRVQSEAMEEHRIKEAQNRKKATKSKLKEDFSRFEISSNTLVGNKLYDLPLDSSETISNVLTRSYSLFKKLPTIINEGFYQTIKDKKNNSEFSIALNQFGLGYYSDKNDKSLQESISVFHTTLFSPSLTLEKCEISYESDFGKISVGFDGEKLIYKEENDDNKT